MMNPVVETGTSSVDVIVKNKMERIQKPNRIAICFVGGNKERDAEQIENIKGIEDLFEIEYNFRSDKFSGPYSSFSQLINEAVVETESEFMIFVNPKTIITKEDIVLIIDDLCSGFAFSSVVNFGLWGVTKELFRKIGLMDERFIGGCWEDNDLLSRLKEANLAVNARYLTEKYPFSWLRHIAKLSGTARQIYKQKWFSLNGQRYRTDLFLEEKSLPRKIQENNRPDISASWKDWSHSIGHDNQVYKEVDSLNVSNIIAKSKQVKNDCTIKFKRNDDSFKLEFLCDKETEIHAVILPGYPIGKEGTEHFVPLQWSLNSNHWQSVPISYFNNCPILDIRIFDENNLILNNAAYDYNHGDLSYELGINITSFIV